jgi:hypothetical protein
MDIHESAWIAASQLAERGFVEVITVRRRPGTSCHHDNRHEYRISEHGGALQRIVNATSQKKLAVPESLTPSPASVFKKPSPPLGKAESLRVFVALFMHQETVTNEDDLLCENESCRESQRTTRLGKVDSRQ